MLMTAKPKFTLGQVVATPGALAALEQASQTATEFLECVNPRRPASQGRRGFFFAAKRFPPSRSHLTQFPLNDLSHSK